MQHIEPAALADLPRLADFLGQLFSIEPDFKPDRERQLRGLRQIIENPQAGNIFVIKDNGLAVGMINLVFNISTAEGGWVAVLEDLFILEEHRNHGLGSRLVVHALEFARARGITRVTLLTESANQGAVRFYARHGFKFSTMRPMRLQVQGMMATLDA